MRVINLIMILDLFLDGESSELYEKRMQLLGKIF